MTTMDEYKTTLGYGDRVNLFEVELTFPTALNLEGFDPEEEIKILCHEAPLPTSRTITPVEIIYAGNTIKLAGDKEAEEDLTIAFRNKKDMKLRTAFELWTNIIQDDETNERVDPEIYEASKFFISSLDNQGNANKKVELLHAFPTTVERIEQSKESSAEISITTVTFSFSSHRNVAI